MRATVLHIPTEPCRSLYHWPRSQGGRRRTSPSGGTWTDRASEAAYAPQAPRLSPRLTPRPSVHTIGLPTTSAAATATAAAAAAAAELREPPLSTTFASRRSRSNRRRHRRRHRRRRCRYTTVQRLPTYEHQTAGLFLFHAV